MEDLHPDEYEALTGITKVQYETRVLAGARGRALELYPPGKSDATIESVEIDGTGLDTSLVILFRIPERPECLFGYRRELWPVEAWRERTPEDEGVVAIEFDIGEFVDQRGLVYGDCERGRITWLD